MAATVYVGHNCDLFSSGFQQDFEETPLVSYMEIQVRFVTKKAYGRKNRDLSAGRGTFRP